MEVRDGFIVGIFNYCDRWCETCAFTSRCRVFADVAETSASLDPNLKPVVDAPVLPEEVPPPLPRWLQEMINEIDEAAAKIDAGEIEEIPQRSPPREHRAIEKRARDYCFRVHPWLQKCDDDAVLDPANPCAVIAWFHTMIAPKVNRAITGLAEECPEDRDWPPDHDGSAKVALLGIDRSHAAWLELVERGVISDAEAAPFVADLVWLGEALEQAFPNARAFVRPAFDEPDAVAMLLAQERRVG
ncbi:MAG TPA: hypothetical protein VIR54_10865 [Vicinamibacterales bacterium]